MVCRDGPSSRESRGNSCHREPFWSVDLPDSLSRAADMGEHSKRRLMVQCRLERGTLKPAELSEGNNEGDASRERPWAIEEPQLRQSLVVVDRITQCIVEMLVH